MTEYTSPTTEAILAEDADLAILDFDQPQDEDAALQAAAKQLRPKFMIVERSLAAQFPDETRVKVSFDVPYDKFQDVMAGIDGGDSVAQMDALLTLMGQRQAAVIRAKGFVAAMTFTSKFFECWQKLVGVTDMGESKSSSN